jgi:hypothetical protein
MRPPRKSAGGSSEDARWGRPGQGRPQRVAIAVGREEADLAQQTQLPAEVVMDTERMHFFDPKTGRAIQG